MEKLKHKVYDNTVGKPKATQAFIAERKLLKAIKDPLLSGQNRKAIFGYYLNYETAYNKIIDSTVDQVLDMYSRFENFKNSKYEKNGL